MYVHSCMHVGMHSCMHVCVHACMGVHVCMRTPTSMCTCNLGGSHGLGGKCVRCLARGGQNVFTRQGGSSQKPCTNPRLFFFSSTFFKLLPTLFASLQDKRNVGTLYSIQFATKETFWQAEPDMDKENLLLITASFQSKPSSDHTLGKTAK